MLRSLKKRLKPSPNPTPPENPTNRTVDTGVECDRDAEGEHRQRKISELMRWMGPILPWRQIPTTKEY